MTDDVLAPARLHCAGPGCEAWYAPWTESPESWLLVAPIYGARSRSRFCGLSCLIRWAKEGGDGRRCAVAVRWAGLCGPFRSLAESQRRMAGHQTAGARGGVSILRHGVPEAVGGGAAMSDLLVYGAVLVAVFVCGYAAGWRRGRW